MNNGRRWQVNPGELPQVPSGGKARMGITGRFRAL
jgi:hypothetical protein